MSVLYYSGKANVVEYAPMTWVSFIIRVGKANIVEDDLSRLSMGSLTHIEDEKKELVGDMHLPDYVFI